MNIITFGDLDKFERFCIAHASSVILPAGVAGYLIAYDYRGRAIARCFAHVY
jgi:hypothetical protein